MKKVQIYTVDSFTNQLFKGNPAGVCMADNMSRAEMMLIAKELNLAETAFLIKIDDSNFRVHYFTPTNEIDFCGHATLASAWILGTKYRYIEKTNKLIFKTNAGLIPIDFEINGGKLEKVMMTQIKTQVKEINDSVQYLFDILNLDINNYDNRYPIKLGYTGNWDLFIPIKTKQAIDLCNPNWELLKIHHIEKQITSVHLFTVNTLDDNYLLYTRNFAPAVGIMEDLVTGSANGALIGYLMNENKLSWDNHEFKIMQTNSLNRQGEIFINTDVTSGSLLIQVGGKAVPVFESVIIL